MGFNSGFKGLISSPEVKIFFSDALAKFRKETIGFVIFCLYVRLSVCLSVRLKQLGFNRKSYCEFSYLGVFRKYVQKIPISI